MATKAINEYSSNEFHRWQRSALPGEMVIQDIDAWLIVPSTSKPLCLLELKRSYMHPTEWSPFLADTPNYLACIRLAELAGLSFRVIYWQKGVEFTPETPIASWAVRGVEDGSIDWELRGIHTPDTLARGLRALSEAA